MAPPCQSVGKAGRCKENQNWNDLYQADQVPAGQDWRGHVCLPVEKEIKGKVQDGDS